MKPQPHKTRRAVIGWALAVGLCVVLAADARAQGSVEADRVALEALYRAAGGDGWIDNTNWLSSAPLSDWYGVEVNRNGRVTRLHLGGWDNTLQDFIDHGLTGSLPPELGTLSHLRRLQIGGNAGLVGPIPAELSSLTHLEDLNLQANRLTGSIPAGLGRLDKLEGLWLTGNTLTGQVPTELGDLTGLTRLDLRGTMLSGPLPASLTRLPALTWMQLEGSGLCVPDSPAFKVWVATIRDFTGAVCTGSPTFLRVVTQPGLGRLDVVHAVADLNGDGRGDILAGAHQEYNIGAPEERFMKTTLHILVGEADGSFTYAPELVEGTIDARVPMAVADDFNGDGRADLAVFDYGGYLFAQRRGYGNPPQLFLSSPNGRLRPSDALADAVRREHELRPDPSYSGPADLHLKSATSGDIDGDGDIDLWVDSIGGLNVSSHFMVNNGDGTFTVDEARAPPALRYNWPEGWYHLEGRLVDLDNEGNLDLALGQNRKIAPGVINQFSIVLVDDGAGYYPTRIELPHPAFNEGYTVVTGLTHFDVNGDGFQDLLLAHLRNVESLSNLPGTGRYIQVLINRDGMSFGDETATWMADQSATTPELRNPAGEPLYNAGGLGTWDVDRDGCADLVMLRSAHVRTESPLVYRNDGSGRFQPMSPVPFAGSTPYFGFNAVPADVNGDTAIDFVVPYHENGPDGRLGTADDFTLLVTLLNTTPARPGRCRPRVAAVGTLPALTLNVGAGAVVVPLADAFRNASTYQVASSAPGVAAASLSGSQVMLTAVAVGVATITVTASGADNSRATQRFRVTVLPAATPGRTTPLTLDLTCHGYDEGATRAYNCIPEPSQQRHMRTFVPAVGSACDQGRIAEFPAGRIVFQIRCRDASLGQSAAWSYAGRGPESFVKPIDIPRVWVRTAFSGNSAHLSVWCLAPRENLLVNELLGGSWENDGTNGIYGMAGCREVAVDTRAEDLQWWFTTEPAATALTPPRSWEHVTGAGSALGAEALDDLAAAAELERAWRRPDGWLPSPRQGANTRGALPSSGADGDPRVDLRIASRLDDPYALDGGLARGATTRTVPLTLDLT